MQEQQQANEDAQAEPKRWYLPSYAIRTVSKVCSGLYSTKYAMQYVRIEAEGDECLVVGTDGRRLLVSRHATWLKGSGPVKRVCAMIHRRIASVLSCNRGWVKVDESGKTTIAFCGHHASTVLSVENSGSKYPDWRMVLNRFGGNMPQQKLAGAIKIDMRLLIELLEPMVKLSENDLDSDSQQCYCYVSIDLETGQLTIQSRDFQDLGILMGAKEPNES